MGTQTQNGVLPELPARMSPAPAPAKAPKKKLVRRTEADRSQIIRRTFQLLFLAWNIYLGTVFYFWVRHYEIGIDTRSAVRPPGVEGWLPIAGLMNLKYWLVTGRVPAIHPAAMFLLVSFLAMAFLFRKAFCSWLCPIGTLSEYLWRAGRLVFGRNLTLPRWLDIPLRGLKYLLLGFFAWAVSTLSADAIAAFMGSPYGAVADVQMLNFFRHIGETGLIVFTILVFLSVLVQNFWCRYLCPYGALLGLTSFLSPTHIRRVPDACIDCAKCAKACPSVLPVDKLVSIKSAECTGCLECVAVCPAQGALTMRSGWGHGPDLRPWAVAAGVVLIFAGIVGGAKITGHWKTDLPRSVYLQLVPRADQAAHPMPGDPTLSQ